MPGYVVHMVQAYKIIAALSEKCSISDDWKERFITGNLLPDTRLRKDKYISHFWNKEEMHLLAKAPDLDMFTYKYGSSADDPLLFGYLSHLYLDAEYVRHFWPRIIEFYGKDGEPEEDAALITEVKIKKTGLRTPVSDFFSERYYYGDYTKMNAYFIDKYHILPPKWEDIRDFSMDEVRIEDMSVICRGFRMLEGRSHPGDEKDLRVFDLESFEEFIDESYMKFMRTYCGDAASQGLIQ